MKKLTYLFFCLSIAAFGQNTGQETGFNPIVGVYNTSNNTYQKLNTNLTNTSGLSTIHQMCIVNDKMYIIFGDRGESNDNGQWDVLVSDLP
jgi:hypothetical protein